MSLFDKLRQGMTGRDLLVFLLKLIVSAALIGWVLSRLEIADLKDAIKSPHWGWLALAMISYGLSAFGGAMQWSWILRAAGINAPGQEVRRLYFIGLFFNNFLPANIGGDAWKIVDLGRQEGRSAGVLCATILDRLIGLGALTLLAVLAMTVAAMLTISLPKTALLLFPVLALLFVLLVMLLSRRLGSLAVRFADKIGLKSVGKQLGNLTAEFQLYRSKVRWLNAVFLFSILVQFLRLTTHLLVALGLGYSITSPQALQLLVLIPMLAISLTLPVTINGIGLRESISAKLLVLAGLAAPQAVAMELGAYLVQVIFSLQGGVLLWMGHRRQPDNKINTNEVTT